MSNLLSTLEKRLKDLKGKIESLEKLIKEDLSKQDVFTDKSIKNLKKSLEGLNHLKEMTEEQIKIERKKLGK